MLNTDMQMPKGHTGREGIFLPVLLLLAAVFLLPGCSRAPESGEVDIVQALSGGEDLSCYERADRPKSLAFPRDMGPHDGFKTEWWYYTGNLETRSGRQFGFQLTFFRQALACAPPKGSSAWRTSQLYLAHFALTDVANRRFYSSQRMARGSLGIAGARPSGVWLDNWSADSREPGTIRLKARDRLPAKGESTERDIEIALTLTRTKPLIPQGQNGWSRKGPKASDASYYYSYPGMAATGIILLGDERLAVSGRAWFDHEWSTAALGKAALGWDWFALHLTSGPHAGTDLMVCEVRQKQGPPVKFGSLSLPDGSYLILGRDAFTMTTLDSWTSPASGRTYPSRWRIRLPGRKLDFEVVPVIPDQEHSHGLVYYEGAVGVQGQAGSAPAAIGRGYVEMTGY